MPTSRPRHSITETDSIAHAIDVARQTWPEVADDRAALLRRLVEHGAARLEASGAEQRVRRLLAVDDTAGILAGVYRTDEARLLHDEWPA